MRILVGYDESNSSKAAIRLAITHAKAFNGKIDLAYSLIERTNTDYDRIDRARIELESQKKYVLDAGVACEAHLLLRDLTPGEDLVEFAKENQVDEIIIGVKRRSRLEKILFGSNAQYIITQAHCPVVTVK